MAEPSAANAKPNVLIVDDQPRNLDVLEVMLADTSCHLIRATSADEALLCLVRNDFAALVLDIRMPGMGGIELATLIKQRKRSQHVPILFLTAHSGNEDEVLRGYGVGAVDYLSKPINAEILRSKIGVFVDLYRKTRALAEVNEALQREVVEREKAQAALQLANHDLERRVEERTAALTQAAAERERLLKSEREARDEAERQGRLKDEFLATLSHELRTPMNAILGWLSILESGKPIREIHSALAVVRRNADLQAKLIEDLLDMNRFISGNVHLEMAAVEVGALLQTTMQGLQPAADAKGVQLIASVSMSDGQLIGDSRRLQQVLWNLVHNSIKFTPKSGRIEIHLHKGDEQLTITVQDNGQGISQAFLPHVFERFRQQDSSYARAAFGLGLGLSIVKQIVELHGGTIEARSGGENQGATFIVRVPAAGAAAPAQVTEREAALESETGDSIASA
jgi:signal transduction histidine kinase